MCQRECVSLSVVIRKRIGITKFFKFIINISLFQLETHKYPTINPHFMQAATIAILNNALERIYQYFRCNNKIEHTISFSIWGGFVFM